MDTTRSSLFYKVLAVLSLKQGAKFNAETTALVVLPGVADSRLAEVEWQKYVSRVWVAGTRGDPAYTRADIERLLDRGGKLPAELVCGGYVLNAREQMDWVVDQLLLNPMITTVIVSTARYHLPRCTLTFIKVWQARGDGRKLNIAILPTRDPVPEEYGAHAETNYSEQGEILRIKEYQVKGDVATEEEFATFLRVSDHFIQ